MQKQSVPYTWKLPLTLTSLNWFSRVKFKYFVCSSPFFQIQFSVEFYFPFPCLFLSQCSPTPYDARRKAKQG